MASASVLRVSAFTELRDMLQHCSAGIPRKKLCKVQANSLSTTAGNAFQAWVMVRYSSAWDEYGLRLLVIRGPFLSIYKPAANGSIRKALMRGPQFLARVDASVRCKRMGCDIILHLPANSFVGGRLIDAESEAVDNLIRAPHDTILHFHVMPPESSADASKIGLENIEQALDNAAAQSSVSVGSDPVEHLCSLPAVATKNMGKAPYQTPDVFFQITATGASAKFDRGVPSEQHLRNLFSGHSMCALRKGTTYLWLITAGGSFRWAPERQSVLGRDKICHGDLNSFGFTSKEIEFHSMRGVARAGGEINFRTVYDSQGEAVAEAWVMDDRTSFQGQRAAYPLRDPVIWKIHKLGQKLHIIKEPEMDEDLLPKAASYLHNVLQVDLEGVYTRSDLTKKACVKELYGNDWKDHLESESLDVLAEAPYIRLIDAHGRFRPSHV